MSRSNCLRIWEVADHLALSGLLNASKVMCMANFEAISESAEPLGGP